MKKTLALLAGMLALGTTANAAAINPDTNLCMAEVATALETNTSYDAFIPTKYLDKARVVDWKAPYSDANATPVATLVMIEGEARKKGDHDESEEVTVKCGMAEGTVKAIEILLGHDIKMTSPIAVAN